MTARTERVNDSEHAYDVLIVGSGLLGAVYARTIYDADRSIRILMIDIGAQYFQRIGSLDSACLHLCQGHEIDWRPQKKQCRHPKGYWTIYKVKYLQATYSGLH